MAVCRHRGRATYIRDSNAPHPNAPATSLDLLRELIAYPSVTLTPNAELMARVSQLLRNAGIESMLVPDPDDGSRCNLFASVGPSDVPGVMLSGHTDVVPVEGQPWSVPAFEATEKDGRMRFPSWARTILPKPRPAARRSA